MVGPGPGFVGGKARVARSRLNRMLPCALPLPLPDLTCSPTPPHRTLLWRSILDISLPKSIILSPRRHPPPTATATSRFRPLPSLPAASRQPHCELAITPTLEACDQACSEKSAHAATAITPPIDSTLLMRIARPANTQPAGRTAFWRIDDLTT